MQRDTCVCIFFKTPVPGKVKTRLIPAVGADGAAALAEAFFRDTWDSVKSLDWAVPIVASTEFPQSGFLRQPNFEVWLQGYGDLGKRLEKILTAALTRTRFGIALGADSPGIPARLLEQAHDALLSADAVLGPSDDGGFYLLGIRHCPPNMLSGIPWSQPTTFACTLERLRELGMKTAILEPWFDIDRPEDLERTTKSLAGGLIKAPYTAKTLAALYGLPAPGSAATTSVPKTEWDVIRKR